MFYLYCPRARPNIIREEREQLSHGSLLRVLYINVLTENGTIKVEFEKVQKFDTS